MSTDESANSSATTSLLSVLQAFQQAQQTRHSLQSELDLAMSSFLTQTPSTWSNDMSSHQSQSRHINDNVLQQNGHHNGSTCAQEAVQIRAPNDEEITQIVTITMQGLLDIKLEMKQLQTLLIDKYNRKDLANLIQQIEQFEQDKLKHTVERDQLRRLSVLEPDKDFTQAISQADTKKVELAQRIQEESREIAAEIADLSADT
ncbi:hypothetical protein OIO90_005571 [Microbotryomycetes sp. JL221]|nr:hypothetical protein OIO90_005571 [Microbotryomycetes sp. JL221]